jgi:hypothetical protein
MKNEESFLKDDGGIRKVEVVAFGELRGFEGGRIVNV